jgi:hypothetical protein
MKSITSEHERSQAILDQVRLGIGSSRWHVITANRGYLRGQGIVYSLLAPFAFGVGGFMAVLGVSEWNVVGENKWLFIFMEITILLSVGGLVTEAISSFRQAAHAEEQQLIFMSEGLVEYGVIRKRVRMDRVIFYDEVAHARLKTWINNGRYRWQHVGVAFVLHDNTTFDWESEIRFGSQEEIAEQVIASFVRYQARHSPG